MLAFLRLTLLFLVFIVSYLTARPGKNVKGSNSKVRQISPHHQSWVVWVVIRIKNFCVTCLFAEKKKIYSQKK